MNKWSGLIICVDCGVAAGRFVHKDGVWLCRKCAKLRELDDDNKDPIKREQEKKI